MTTTLLSWDRGNPAENEIKQQQSTFLSSAAGTEICVNVLNSKGETPCAQHGCAFGLSGETATSLGSSELQACQNVREWHLRFGTSSSCEDIPSASRSASVFVVGPGGEKLVVKWCHAVVRFILRWQHFPVPQPVSLDCRPSPPPKSLAGRCPESCSPPCSLSSCLSLCFCSVPGTCRTWQGQPEPGRWHWCPCPQRRSRRPHHSSVWHPPTHLEGQMR